MIKKFKKNIFGNLTLLISSLFVLFGIVMFIDGILFNEEISGVVEAGLGIIISTIYTFANITTYFGMKKKNYNLILTGLIVYSLFAIFLLIMLFSVDIVNIVLIVISFILLILSTVNYALLTKK
jgi:hypothetical protein